MKGSLKIVNNNECNQSYTDEEQLPEGITNAQICAWDPEGERDTWWENWMLPAPGYILKFNVLTTPIF